MKKIMLAALVIFSVLGSGLSRNAFSAVNFGAVGNGKTDDSQAFLKAWKATCGAAGTPTFHIPAGKTFLLQPLAFEGPCRSTRVHVQIDGKIVAPASPGAWSACAASCWIGFSGVSNLVVSGSGVIDGRGAPWWAGGSNPRCSRPRAVHFNNCKNLKVTGITITNSPKGHMSINSCTKVSVSNLRIISPGKSPNTDGIDISDSRQVNIFDLSISNGDDCIAINSGSIDVNITHVTCSFGHGISIGSLGRGGEQATVENVRVRNCIFNRTKNGARIKTWPRGSGFAKDITFEHITLIASEHPIIITQHYNNKKPDAYSHVESGVAISDVKFIGFTGTSASEEAIILDCSKRVGCDDIVLDHVILTSSVQGKHLTSTCDNVHGTSTSTVPSVPCLSGH